MFGVGGGFLTTPLLIVYGIPPTVAAASSASQVTGASVSGVFAHCRRRGVDVKMGGVLVAGGMCGSVFGAWLFRLLQASGQIDTVIAVIYVLLLGSIGSLMAKEAVRTILDTRTGRPIAPKKRRHHPLVAALPMRMRFYQSRLYISPLAPLMLGFFTGTLTILLGIGGGFILVPAMIYLFGMSTQVVVGTSLFQTLFVTALATMVHATTTKGGRYRTRRIAAGRLGGGRAGRCAPGDEGQAGLSAARPGAHGVGRRRQDLPWARLAARRDILGRAVLRRLLLLAPLLMGQAKPVLVPDVSQRNVEIAYSFTGADLLLFGAILYPRGRVPNADERTDVVIVVKGPTESITVRQKEKVAGLWVNAARLRYRSAPSFLCHRIFAPYRRTGR